jgi:hypothetical protein
MHVRSSVMSYLVSYPLPLSHFQLRIRYFSCKL